MQPAVGHRDDVPERVGQRVVERPGRERRADEQPCGRRRRTRHTARACRAGSRRGRSGATPSASGRRRSRPRRGCRGAARSGRSPARLSSARPIRRRTCAVPRAGRVTPSSRLPIGSKVGCASVSRASKKSRVSSARGVARLRARPMKSTRAERKPSGATSAARTPIAFECLSQARTAWRPATYSTSAKRRLYCVWPRSASGRLSTHSRYGHDLQTPRGVRQVLQRDRPDLGRVPGRRQADLGRRADGVAGADHRRGSRRPSRSGATRPPGPAQLPISIQGRGGLRVGIHEEDRAAGRVEEVVGPPADVVSLRLGPARRPRRRPGASPRTRRSPG